MSPITTTHKCVRYQELFPDWRGRRPWPLFMLENLLETRSESHFPTNSRGPDEDVNVYLAHLLSQHLYEPVPIELLNSPRPLLCAPAKLSGQALAAWWRSMGDHRLLCLGLYERGDLLRRRRELWGMTEEQTRTRDFTDGQSCFTVAAGLAENTAGCNSGLAAVLGKLAENFGEYVHVLQTLASRRLGLGTHLSEMDLQRLLS